jgi:hypothetical protein
MNPRLISEPPVRLRAASAMDIPRRLVKVMDAAVGKTPARRAISAMVTRFFLNNITDYWLTEFS